MAILIALSLGLNRRPYCLLPAMKFYLPVFLSLLTSLEAFSQQKLPISKSLSDDGLYNVQRIHSLGKRLSLASLLDSLQTIHVRLFDGPQVIDFWQTVPNVYKGQLMNWTQEVSPGIEEPTNRIFSAVHPLNLHTVRALFSLLDSCQILSVPDEKAIPDWKPALDGRGYTIEYNLHGKCQVKSYGNPDLQGSLKEAAVITKFIHRLEAIVHSEEQWKAFAPTIPFQCYGDGSASVACRILTNSQLWEYKRERKRYRQQKQ